MPHFIVECSDNIREEADLPRLFAKVNPALAATGIFFRWRVFAAARTGSIPADGRRAA
ncbi:hypothetical protein ACP0HM_28365 [Escherichia coli]